MTHRTAAAQTQRLAAVELATALWEEKMPARGYAGWTLDAAVGEG